MKRILGIVAALASAFAALTAASASPIISGDTVLDPTFNLASKGLRLSANGSTRVEGGDFVLPMSGGYLTDSSVGVAEHEGAYINIDNTSNVTAILWDLKIDTQGSLGFVTGNILASSMQVTGVSLFVFDISNLPSIANLGSSPLEIYFTSSLSGFLSSLYGIDRASIEGKQFGFITARAMTENYAAILRELEKQPVLQNPIPASVLLFLTGFAGLFARNLRKRAAA